MKTHLRITALILIILTIALSAFARDYLTKDNDKTKTPGFAPNGSKNVNLTVVKQTVDMREDITWEVYTPTACKFRVMTSATERGLTRTLAANERNQRNVNSKYPFVQYTGCTNGELERH